VHKPTLVGDGAIGTDEYVVCNRLTEDLHFEYVRNNLLRFTVNVWMDEGDIVVARDNIA
jgi:hypothetical protein